MEGASEAVDDGRGVVGDALPCPVLELVVKIEDDHETGDDRLGVRAIHFFVVDVAQVMREHVVQRVHDYDRRALGSVSLRCLRRDQ